MNPKLARLIKEIQFRTPLRRYFFHRYQYNFSPVQLCFLCQCIENTKNCDGVIAEIGCAHGGTTVFLNKFMDAQNIEKKYFAMDTFSGFVSEDIKIEVDTRNKKESFFDLFQVNKKKWFDATMAQNKIQRVESIETDVNQYDLTSLGTLSFVLLDVDLYRPIKKCLKELYQILAPGGIIVVDDCDSEHIKWDGAYQAYEEFMKEMNQPLQIVHKKLGILKKS